MANIESDFLSTVNLTATVLQGTGLQADFLGSMSLTAPVINSAQDLQSDFISTVSITASVLSGLGLQADFFSGIQLLANPQSLEDSSELAVLSAADFIGDIRIVDSVTSEIEVVFPYNDTMDVESFDNRYTVTKLIPSGVYIHKKGYHLGDRILNLTNDAPTREEVELSQLLVQSGELTIFMFDSKVYRGYATRTSSVRGRLLLEIVLEREL